MKVRKIKFLSIATAMLFIVVILTNLARCSLGRIKRMENGE